MKSITIPGGELWDERHRKFIYPKEQTIQIEHSLVSLKKWESKWNKPFLGNESMSSEQIIDYIRCMTITQNVDPMIYYNLTPEMIKEISDYIQAPMTATWFGEEDQKHHSQRIVTAEVIYYWMISHQIPMECQKWHLNQLLTLIRVCNAENAPRKKLSHQELIARNRAINQRNRKKYNSKG